MARELPQAGETVRDAFLAYKTFGDASNPAIVYPTWSVARSIVFLAVPSLL